MPLTATDPNSTIQFEGQLIAGLQQRLLMFSALFAFAYSYPLETQSGNGSLLKNASESLDFTNKKSTVVYVEEKSPGSGSVVVEFIYNGNNENSVYSSGTDKDKYVIDPQANEVSDGKSNLKENKTFSSNQNAENENPVQANESKSTTTFKTDENTGTKSSGENLPRKQQNYFYGDYYPVPPFPEQDTRINPLNPLSIYDREFRRPLFDSQFQRHLYI